MSHFQFIGEFDLIGAIISNLMACFNSQTMRSLYRHQNAFADD